MDRDVERARAGDDAAFARLVALNWPILARLAGEHFAPGMDREDFLQEARVGLMKAVRDFNPDLSVPFGAFVRLCVERQLHTAVRAALRQKHEHLNDAKDINDTRLVSRSDVPYRTLVAREQIEKLFVRIRRDLSPIERRALVGLVFEDRTYEEMANTLGVSVKALDNAMQRARGKLGVAHCEGCGHKISTDDRLCEGCVAEARFWDEAEAA